MSVDDKRLALEQLQKGTLLHRAGQIGLAQSHYQRAVKLDPTNADAWHLLGVAALQSDNPALAAKSLRTCIKVRPAFAEAHNNLGVALRQAGRHAEAIAAFRAALAVRNGYVDAVFNLGIAFEAAGSPGEAERAYRQALAWRANHVDAAINLANLLSRHGRRSDALPLLETAQRLAPERAQTNGNLALLLSDLGRQFDALHFARKAVGLEPERALWWKALGVAQRLLHDVENSIETLRKALALDPGDAGTTLELGLALSEAGAIDEARTLFAGARTLPGCGERVRWLRALSLPALYRDDAQIDAARAYFSAGLDELDAGLDLDTPQSLREAVQAVVSVAPFYLQYQACDNTALQCRFGDLVTRIMARAAPELVEKCNWVPHAHGGRIRVGIVSNHLMQHTVSRYFTALLSGFDSQRFEVKVWYAGGTHDASTDFIAAKVDAFVQTQGDALAVARDIRRAQLDVLVYPEIGMDPHHQALAALRLAPVQCVLYGHPATSGLANIDYFLSSDALEPANGDQHYRERLVRLPGLGTRPLPPPAPGNGAWFDEQATNVPLLLCLQNFIKLIPSYDRALARIAAETGARIGFFTRNPPLMRRFRERIGATFKAHGLDPEKHLLFLPVRTHPDYLAGVARAPFVLDSPGFSGGGTSLDAFSVGTPVLAWEGAMARGRQTSGMLRILDIEELIAQDEDDYVAKAAALIRDPGHCSELRNRILARKPALFDDDTAVIAFAEFLQSVQPRA